MAVLTYKGGKYRNLAGNKIYDGSKWVTMGGDSKIFLDGKWHDFSWKKAELPDVPDDPEIPSWDDFTHLATEEPTTGNVYYMTPAGAGAMDGSSWENAWSASQIHVAMLSMSRHDRLYMAEGDYGTLEIPLQPSAVIGIYGGFIEGDYSWETRDAFNHPTVWSGNSVVPFVTMSEVHDGLDGLTLKNFYDSSCGGLYTNLTSIHCTFGNGSVPGNNQYSKFTNCRFLGNADDKVTCLYASKCYFRGEEGSLFPVYASAITDSIVVRCTAASYPAVGFRMSVVCETSINTWFYDINVSNSEYNGYEYLGVVTMATTGCTLVRCVAYEVAANVDGCTMISCHGNINTKFDPSATSYIVNCTGAIDVTNAVVVSCDLSSLSCIQCSIIDCTVDSFNSIILSKVINTILKNPHATLNFNNSLCVNSYIETVLSTYVANCTFVNSSVSLSDNRSKNNVFWNNNGTIPALGNAQTAYNADNVLTLGTDNSIARFVNTGYAPAIGVQDVGKCPDPTTDPDGFADYIASFGDWHPQAESFLIGKGMYTSNGTTDLDGVNRPNPPTLGCYEPRPAETE